MIGDVQVGKSLFGILGSTSAEIEGIDQLEGYDYDDYDDYDD